MTQNEHVYAISYRPEVASDINTQLLPQSTAAPHVCLSAEGEMARLRGPRVTVCKFSAQWN